jgi:hypothetical protein
MHQHKWDLITQALIQDYCFQMRLTVSNVVIDNGEMEITFGAINFISIRKLHRYVTSSNKMLWALILIGNLTACF